MQDKPMDGWAWFEGASAARRDPAVRRAFVRTFNSDAGRQVLAYLRAATVERRTPPEAPGSMLRHLEGQRYLFQLIERLADAELEEGADHD
jgi:hypothetical protein